MTDNEVINVYREIKKTLTGVDVGKLASRALSHPEHITHEEIRILAASALSQRQDRETRVERKKKK